MPTKAFVLLLGLLGGWSCRPGPAAATKQTGEEVSAPVQYDLMKTLLDQGEEIQERIEERDRQLLNASGAEKKRWQASRSRLWAEKANLDRYARQLSEGQTGDRQLFEQKMNRSLRNVCLLYTSPSPRD